VCVGGFDPSWYRKLVRAICRTHSRTTKGGAVSLAGLIMIDIHLGRKLLMRVVTSEQHVLSTEDLPQLLEARHLREDLVSNIPE
jgi:hypothetical protein